MGNTTSMTYKTWYLEDDGQFPNNQNYNLIIYPAFFSAEEDQIDQKFIQIINQNGWQGIWKNGIFPYQHYHSNAHELLAVYSGDARVQLGGPVNGVIFKIQAGDALILPAGTAHKRMDESGDFACIGAYPPGQEDYDMMYGEDEEREKALRNIQNVPLPEFDPLLGNKGALIKEWQKK